MMKERREQVGSDAIVQRSSTGLPGKRTLTELLPVQRTQGPTAPAADSVQHIANAGISGASEALPHRDTIQQAFGRHDISHVRAAVGGEGGDAAQAIGAQAYATGDRIAFADSPDLHTAAHEAAHIVQQRAGVSLKGGVGQTGDAYEQHADAVADAVVAGKSVETLLDGSQGGGPPGGGLQRKEMLAAPAPATHVVKIGDSLQTIAVTHKVTVEAIKTANASLLKTWKISSGGTVQGFDAGVTIVIPGAVPTATAPVTTATATATTAKQTATAEPGIFDGALAAIGNAVSGAVDTVTSTLKSAWSSLVGPDGTAVDPSKVAVDEGSVVKGPAPSEQDKAAGPPLAGLSAEERGKRLNTFTNEELAAADSTKKGFTKKGNEGAIERGQFIEVSEMKPLLKLKGQAFVDAVDKTMDKKQFSKDQSAAIEAAKQFAAQPSSLSSAQEAMAAINWSSVTTELDGKKLNADLQQRVNHFSQFLAWAQIVKGPPSVTSVMRSPKKAHELSTSWMASPNNSGNASLKTPTGRKKFVDGLVANGGSDSNGKTWVSATDIAKMEAVKDNDALLAPIVQTVAPKVHAAGGSQNMQAAEGYTTTAERHPNILPGTGVSNHLIGEAVDIWFAWVFPNGFDPIVDALALYFGLWRPVKESAKSPEQHHYERIGSPLGTES
jgi:uncharacterized protein DUF4157/LysM domain-containing protein